MSTVRINVGGNIFEATRSTWAKSPVLDMILRRSAEPVPFIDRSPDVFYHILDWLREGKLYINFPSDYEYGRLCADADFYGLEDLSRFLENRINLCPFIYFRSPNGDLTFCNLDAFRALEPADGIIDRLLAGDRDALAHIVFISPDTVPTNTYPRKISDILLAPQLSRRPYYSNDGYSDGKALFGSRLTGSSYEPKLRAERSS